MSGGKNPKLQLAQAVRERPGWSYRGGVARHRRTKTVVESQGPVFVIQGYESRWWIMPVNALIAAEKVGEEKVGTGNGEISRARGY